MDDVIEQMNDWIRQGRRVALATVVSVERRAPRDPGASMVVNDHGEIAGSVSGGCVEGVLVETAKKVMGSGEPALVTFGISDDEAFGVGLSCGGTIHVFVERVDW
jgi:xanthine dehydrogenase accessory factor